MALEALKLFAAEREQGINEKIESLEKYGIDVKKRIDSETEPTTENKKYLETKRDKMGHYILKK